MAKLCDWWVKDDCCGVFCGAVTNILLGYALFVQLTFVLGPYWGILHPVTLIYVALTSMAAFCHFRVQFTNPGAVPLDNESLIDLEQQNVNHSKHRYCKHCKQYKPNEAHHCSTCNRCILRMDHHCPWVNNCVALFNQKYFVLFCFYTSLCCIFSIISLISRFVVCQSGKHSMDGSHTLDFNNGIGGMNAELQEIIDNNDFMSEHKDANIDGMTQDPWCRGGSFDVMLCIINLMEAILFGLFTLIMSCDQISSIISNITYIDTLLISRQTLQKRKKQASSMENLIFAFGEPFGIRWFLPTPLTPKIQENFRNLCTQF